MMTGGKVRLRHRAPWRPPLTDEQVREIAALVPDDHHVSIVSQGRPGTWRIHLFRDGEVPPIASRWGVSASFAHYVAELVAEVGQAA